MEGLQIVTVDLKIAWKDRCSVVFAVLLLVSVFTCAQPYLVTEGDNAHNCKQNTFLMSSSHSPFGVIASLQVAPRSCAAGLLPQHLQKEETVSCGLRRWMST